jgi:hypothetical protein
MLPKTILRGYDKVTMKYVADALGMKLPKHKRKGGDRRMKIPMSALKKSASTESPKEKKGKGMKFGAMKGKKKDNDADDY